MLGIIVEIALSIALLWIFCKKPITVLGIKPSLHRLKVFLFGMLVMALLCTFNLWAQTYFKQTNYVLNPDYGFMDALNGIYWTIKAAMFEELIFRGAILYILMRKLGWLWGCLISAAAFGVYHWFSYNMFDRGLIPMAYVFLMTGAAGWMFAYTFYKTKSIYTPLGLHFGWIVMSIVLFSAGPLGNSLFVLQGEEVEMGGWPQLFFFLFQTVMVPGGICWYFARRYKPERLEFDS